MERNIKLFRAHRALSWLYLVMLATIGVAVLIAATHSHEWSLAAAAPLFVMLGLFFLHHYTAKGAREGKPWARTMSIVISILLLFGFPVGTLIGVYLLANTWSPWDRPADAPATA